MPDEKDISKTDVTEPLSFDARESWREFLDPLDGDTHRAAMLAQFLLSVHDEIDSGKHKLARATLMRAINFDPSIESEIKKTRPALIVQNDIANRHSSITIVAAITSRFDKPLYPTEVLIAEPEGGLTKDSVVLLNQVRSIDIARLAKRLGSLRPATMWQVERALQISFGLVRL